MSADPMPKEFEKTTEVLPFTKYGLSTFEDFKKAEKDIQHVEWLKRIGLSNEEIKLYQDNEAGMLDQRMKVESSVLKSKLEDIYNKINSHQDEASNSKQPEEASTSDNQSLDLLDKIQKKPLTFYPEGHPMNDLKQMEQDLLGHLKTEIIPISKRRKMLRRIERRKERLLAKQQEILPTIGRATVPREGSLWDMTEKPVKSTTGKDKGPAVIGPKKQTMYTVKDNKIVRLEPINVAEEAQNEEEREPRDQEYRAVDIVVPENAAEEELLEGTKMCVDDIRKIERFKDYEPGIPSKVLYMKNISPSVSEEQLSLLFNQFHLENGGAVDIRLLSGRMRGQAFVSFQSEDLAIRALDEVNGTILSGKPVIVEFGRNSNRIQDDNR